MSDIQSQFNPQLARRRHRERVVQWLFLFAILVGLSALVVLMVDVILAARGWLDWQFLTSYPSRFPVKAGIRSALIGTLWLMGLTALFSIPVGIATAIYLEEYARKNRFTAIIQANISNLAGVPSIVYGVLGLTVFVGWFALGRSLLAGALTMSIMILPVIIVSAEEAIKAVSASWRHAAMALGATRWQTVWHIVLPSALPGTLTGVILALSRAIGEAAPLIAIGALMFVPFAPRHLLDRFTVVPIQIYNWTSRPQDEFRALAAAGILVLLVILLGMNATAILLRNKYQRRVED